MRLEELTGKLDAAREALAEKQRQLQDERGELETLEATFTALHARRDDLFREALAEGLDPEDPEIKEAGVKGEIALLQRRVTAFAQLVKEHEGIVRKLEADVAAERDRLFLEASAQEIADIESNIAVVMRQVASLNALATTHGRQFRELAFSGDGPGPSGVIDRSHRMTWLQNIGRMFPHLLDRPEEPSDFQKIERELNDADNKKQPVLERPTGRRRDVFTVKAS